MPEDLASNAARNLRRLRADHGLSLGQLAKRAGVAKTTLANWEAGNANPTLSTAAAVADALGVSSQRLLFADDFAADVRVIRHGEGRRIGPSESPTSFLESINLTAATMEVFEKTLPPHSESTSSGHGRRSLEHAFVSSGSVRIGPLGHEVDLDAGDYASYPAEHPHGWANPGPAPATVWLVLVTPLSERSSADALP